MELTAVEYPPKASLHQARLCHYPRGELAHCSRPPVDCGSPLFPRTQPFLACIRSRWATRHLLYLAGYTIMDRDFRRVAACRHHASDALRYPYLPMDHHRSALLVDDFDPSATPGGL